MVAAEGSPETLKLTDALAITDKTAGLVVKRFDESSPKGRAITATDKVVSRAPYRRSPLNLPSLRRKKWQVDHGRTASMWIEEAAPERLAEFFHHYHKALEVFGKRSESGSWKEMAKPEKNRLVGACLILLELDSTRDTSAKSRQYFAEPGEAEWGC